jgi:ATP-binding cassette subfamily B (MDR/TAP) protein 1
MPEESAVRDMVIQAAEKAQIHSFIIKLPHGYDTVIGANGSRLSGGQRQRIAIARAIVSRPAILLLDEATAALDSESEKEVQEALKQAASGRTTMIIAHRLSTVQNADIIIVLKDGHVVDQGSHADLMRTCTVYQELVKHQALRSNDRPTEDLTCQSSYPEKDVEQVKDVTVHVDGIESPESAPVTTLQHKNSVKYVWDLNSLELPYTIAGVVFSILAGISYPIQAIFFGNGVISMINPGLSTGGHSVRFWALVYLIHGIVVFGIYCIRGYCFAIAASQLNLRARSSLFKSLLMKDLPFFENKGHSIGQLVAFLSSGTHKVTGVSGTSLGLAAESIVMLATGIIVGCIFGWELGLVSTAAVPLVALSGFLQYYIVSQVQKHVKRDTNAASIAHEAFAAIKTVTVLGMQKGILETYQRESRRDSQDNYWVIAAMTYSCTPLLRVLSIAFVFWYGGTRLIATGEYSIQQFFICFAATVWGSQSASALFAHAPDVAGAHAAARRLQGLMQPNDSQSPETQDEVSTPAPCTVESLALQRVEFRYPTRPSHMALNDVNFDVPAGAFIALVGATGSGKSSVINLVERFYAVDSGDITLSEKAIKKYDLNSYRQYLALVDQNPCLVGEDMRECLQSDDRVISDDDIITALKGVGLADFVVSHIRA